MIPHTTILKKEKSKIGGRADPSLLMEFAWDSFLPGSFFDELRSLEYLTRELYVEIILI